MGLPICRRLVQAGFQPAVTDIEGPPLELAGVRWTDSAAAACAGAEIAVTVLPGPAEVASIADQIAGALAPGACWLDLSTASPAVARVVDAACAQRAVGAVDAPVGGGPDAAAAGRLLVFAGGTADDLALARPVLEAVAARIIHTGPRGSGYAVKLLVNAVWFGQAVATAEALSLAGRLGLDLELVRDALGASAAGGRFLEHDARALLAGDDLTSFSLARCCEELASVLAVGEELEVPLPVAAAVSEVHRRALEHYGDVDGELLGARWVAERAGVVLTAPSPSPPRRRG
jgi:3-hydroxyisobutyrate dehydrogenase